MYNFYLSCAGSPGQVSILKIFGIGRGESHGARHPGATGARPGSCSQVGRWGSRKTPGGSVVSLPAGMRSSKDLGNHTRSGPLDLAVRPLPGDRPHRRGANRTSIQTRTQTWSSRISTGNRCTPCPHIVEHRPSLKRNRQRCKGQTTCPSSIQPWPSEPPACGQRSVRAIIVSPARKTARRRPRTSQVRPRPAGISSMQHANTQSAMTPGTRAGNWDGKRRA